MLFRNLVLFAAIAVAITGCAKTPTGPAKPKFDVTDFDFGRIPQGSVVTYVYRLTNAGGDSIIIDRVRPHCGCTKAPLSQNIVHAGETVPIELRFNSRGYRGKSKKSAAVNLTLGEQNQPSFRLSFSTYTDTSSTPFGYGELGIAPYKIEFTDSIEEVELTITNRVAAKRKVEIVSYQSDRIRLSWTERTIGPKEQTTLKVTRIIPATGFAASITMEMPGHGNTRITIPISEFIERGTTRTSSSISRRVSKPVQTQTDPWSNPGK